MELLLRILLRITTVRSLKFQLQVLPLNVTDAITAGLLVVMTDKPARKNNNRRKNVRRYVLVFSL